MKIPDAVLAEVDYRAAVIVEMAARNRYLPPPLAERALIGHVDDLASRLEVRMRRDFQPAHQTSVWARKAGRGSRPLPYVGLDDRLIYRALVNVVCARLREIPSRGDFDKFADSPLKIEDCSYVLKADIAAYYQYIDHERLVDEVVAQTGDDLAIAAIVELLQGGTGRQFGLPQMSGPSDLLGDLYIDPIRRSLVRKGYTAWRYADDFRVACSNYNEALGALEHIERAAFELGLVLNESKTGTPARETYEHSRTEVKRAEQRLFDEQPVQDLTIEEFFAMVAAPYADDDEDPGEVVADNDEPVADEVGPTRTLPGFAHDEADSVAEFVPGFEPTDEQLEVALRVVNIWRDEETRNGYDWNSNVWSNLLRKSLATLEAGSDDRIVDAAISLLVSEPHLTPQICNYLVAVGRNNPAKVQKVLNELCGRDHNIVSVWQSLWIAYLAGSLPGRSDRRSRHIVWLEQQVESADDAVSAQAALALARRKKLTIELGVRAYERSPEPHRLTAALALAAAQGAVGAEFEARDQLEGWLAQWVRKQSWGSRHRIRRIQPSIDKSS